MQSSSRDTTWSIITGTHGNATAIKESPSDQKMSGAVVHKFETHLSLNKDEPCILAEQECAVEDIGTTDGFKIVLADGVVSQQQDVSSRPSMAEEISSMPTESMLSCSVIFQRECITETSANSIDQSCPRETSSAFLEHEKVCVHQKKDRLAEGGAFEQDGMPSSSEVSSQIFETKDMLVVERGMSKNVNTTEDLKNALQGEEQDNTSSQIVSCQELSSTSVQQRDVRMLVNGGKDVVTAEQRDSFGSEEVQRKKMEEQDLKFVHHADGDGYMASIDLKNTFVNKDTLEREDMFLQSSSCHSLSSAFPQGRRVNASSEQEQALKNITITEGLRNASLDGVALQQQGVFSQPSARKPSLGEEASSMPPKSRLTKNIITTQELINTSRGERRLQQDNTSSQFISGQEMSSTSVQQRDVHMSLNGGQEVVTPEQRGSFGNEDVQRKKNGRARSESCTQCRW